MKMKKSKTDTIGNKGEDFVRRILEWKGYTPLLKGKDGKWDLACLIPESKSPDKGNIETFEIKTQPDFVNKRGFSVEIANRRDQYNYVFRTDVYDFDGVKVVPTGLKESTARTYVFTDGKYIAYFVSTKVLKEWAKRVYTQERYRVRFGGNDKGALQIQLRLSELKEIADYRVDDLPKIGRKPKVASL
jgi:hypothetical protein